MKKLYKLSILISMAFIAMALSGCAETAENEHLPEYCQTYSGFMSTSSKDLYDLLDNVNRDNYLSVISTISLEFEVDIPGVEVDLNGIQCFQNLTSLTLIGQSFKDISEISALKNIQSITLIDTSVVSIDSFKNLSKVNDLTISNAKSLQSVDGIEEMTKLVNLDLTDNGIVNIDGLNNLINLETLDLSNNEIVTFPSINALELLTDLTLNNNDITYLGTDLSGLSNLKTFEARHNNISDISSLDDLTSLETLDLSYNNLGAYDLVNGPDFSSLENAPLLKNIYLQFNNLTSIEGLRGKDLPLEKLVLNDNLITDITPISDFTGLVELQLFNNNILEINNLSGMTNLVDIDLRNNRIVDFTDLLTIPNVEFVNLRGNEITFIPDITGWDSIVSLNLHSNLLEDTSGVNGSLTLEELILSNNGLEILSGISNMPYLESLVIDTVEEIDEETLLPIVFDNPNIISTIDDSFNNLERLTLTEEGDLVLDFHLEPNLRILGSFNDLYNVVDIDFSGMEIDEIDIDSINLPNLHGLNVSNNNIADLSFILGNLELEELRIGENSFSNLEIISGVTTDDLSNLQNIFANDIAVGNDLDNAFNELSDLSYLDLSGTNITNINSSFNNLPELSTFFIDSANLESITDSFNLIFASASLENTIIFDAGSIGNISSSFNGGEIGTLTTGKFEQIKITNQTSSVVETEIVDSFNNITGSFVDSIAISANSFKTIDNSFNDSSFVNVLLSNNGIETITNSLTDTIIEDTLYMNVNKIADISTISNITSVATIDISNNILESVASFDGIELLEFVNIRAQYNNDTLIYTLSDLDGLNNMDTLTGFDISLNQFDTISGLQNIGITEFTYQIIDNNNQAFSVDPLAFDGTSLDLLDLDGSLLTNISFLHNLDVITELVVDVDVDPTLFSTANINDTLTSLNLYSEQEVTDFRVFELYDALTELIFDTDANTNIYYLDNMDALTTLQIVNEEDILSITNSFNSLDSYDIASDYLDNYVNLSTITNSFDDYTGTSYFAINDNMNIVNSLNNATRIEVANTTIFEPNFDTLSFDKIVEISFTDPQYNTYAFLDEYTTIRNIVFTNLDLNITNLDNANIESIDIGTLGNAVNALDLAVNSTGSLSFTTGSTGLITIDSNISNYSVDGNNVDVTFNHSETSLSISGDMADVLVNSPTLANLDLSNLYADTLNISSTSLSNVTGSSSLTSNINTATITTEQSLINMELYGDIINLTANDANDITVSAQGATLNLYNTETLVIGDIDTQTLNFNNSSLVSLTLSSPVIDEFNIDAAGFNNLSMTSSTVELLNVTTNVSSLSLSGNIVEGNILDNSLNDLTALGAVNDNIININTSKSDAFSLNVSSNEVNFTAPNLTSVSLSNTSEILNGLNLGTMNGNNTVSLGTADVYSVSLISAVPTFTIDSTLLSVVDLDLTNASSINIDTPSATAVIVSEVSGVTIDAIVNDFEYLNTNATAFTLTDLSVISLLTVDNTQINSFSLGNATIDNALLTTLETNLTLTSPNMVNVVITGNNIDTLNANVGTGDIEYNSSKLGSFNANITANQYDLNVGYNNITINDASNITDMDFISSSNLSTLNTGTGDIDWITINETAASLNVTGSAIADLNVDSAILNNLTTNLNPLTNLTVISSTSSNVSLNIDVEDVLVSTLNASETTIISSELQSAYVDGRDVYYELSKPSLAFVIDGTTDNTYITSTTIDSLNIFIGSSIGDLTLIDTTVNTLNLTNGGINTLTMDGTGSTVNITAPTVQAITLESNTLSTINVDGSVELALLVSSDAGLGNDTLNISGDLDTVMVVNDNLATLNITNLEVNDTLTTVTSSLNDYNEVTSTISLLSITSTENIVNVDTQTSDFTHLGNSSATLNMTTSLTNQQIDTTATVVNLSGSTTDFIIDGVNVNSINGEANNVNVSSDSLSTTNINLIADGFVINNSNSSSLQVNALSSMLFLTAEMDSLSLYNDLSSVSAITEITTLTPSINVTSFSNTVTINGDADGTLNIDIHENNAFVISDMKNMVASNAGNSFSAVYDGSLDFTVNFDNMSDITVSSFTSLSNTFTGSVDNLFLETMSSIDLDFSGLAVDTKLTMNDLGITDLSLITPSIVNSASAIEVNTLDADNTGDVVTLLKDSSITLTSPIVENDIYEYYYDLQIEELTTQEEIDGLRKEGFKAIEVSNILTNTFRLNEYFQYTLDPELTIDIDTQVYEAMQYYYDAYLVGLGTTEEDLITANDAAFVQAIKDSIQATLNDPSLLIDDEALNTQVTNDIATDSGIEATNQTALVGFTLG